VDQYDEQRQIIYITESSGYGGAETYLLDLTVAALEVAAVTVALPFLDQNAKLREELRQRGIRVLQLQQYRAIYPWNFLIALQFFLRHKRALFHFTLPHPDSCRWLLLAASLLRRRFVISELLVPPDPYKVGCYFLVTHLLFNGLKRLSYRRAAKVVAICEGMKNTLIEAYNLPAEQIVVVYNGIEVKEVDTAADTDVVKMATLRQELHLSEGDLLLTTAGRLAEQKGQGFLILALERLVAEFPSVVLLIVGEGPLLSVLKAEVTGRGLDGHVRFAGFREDFRSILQMTDIFVFPSLDEGFPYMITEAMAAGNPIVASAVGGIPEAVINGETGQLVPPKDVEQLYQAIRKLLLDAGLRKSMGEQGRRRARELFSRQITRQKMLALYEDV
jgi:glycosyltransferase involved in cell wall biosynthesis